jgi:hypothetical protein
LGAFRRRYGLDSAFLATEESRRRRVPRAWVRGVPVAVVRRLIQLSHSGKRESQEKEHDADPEERCAV